MIKLEDLVIAELKDTSVLRDFYCGVEPMDRFIHDGLQLSIANHYCCAYTVKLEEASEAIDAIFALNFDSLDLDVDDKDEMMDGSSSADKPLLTDDYKEIFLNKLHYPALEISYLAVRQDLQKSGLGCTIIEFIIKRAQEQAFAGCQFLTVEALATSSYSSVGFYGGCHFSPCEYPNPNKGTLRMYRTLYPANMVEGI